MSVSGTLALLTRLVALVLPDPVGPRRRTQRGDVPGWVMVTVMTAP